MAKLDGIDFSEIEPEQSEVDSDEFWNRSSVFTAYATISYPGQLLEDSSRALLLPLDDGMTPVVTANMTVLIINPRTTRPEQALAYLRTYVQNIDKQSSYITLFPDHDDPLPNTYFERNLASWQKSLDDLNEQVKTAEPEDVAGIKDSIKYYEDLLNNSDQYRYTVSAEAIAYYRQNIAPYVRAMAQTPLNTWNKEGENDLQTQLSQYLQGAISADEFIKAIDNRIRMMQLEDQ